MERKVFEVKQHLARSLGMERELRTMRRSSGGRKGIIARVEGSRGKVRRERDLEEKDGIS